MKTGLRYGTWLRDCATALRCGKAFLLAAGLVSCGRPAAAPEHVHHALPAAEVAAGPAADFSLYNLASSWTDQNGRVRPLGDLKGRVQLVALVYTHCGNACPRIVASMKRIEAAVPGANFVLVSIDPERDTPGRLLEFATGSKLDPARYTLLRGEDADLLELAAALGVRYRQVKPGEFVHSNVISVLDPAGNVVYQQKGFDSEATIRHLHGMLH